MPLTPNIKIPKIVKSTVGPSKTYRLDTKAKRIVGKIDELEAIKQFVMKAIRTVRYSNLIYSHKFGCQIKNLLGKGLTEEYIKSEVPRLIAEALIYDERIIKVHSFDIEVKEDKMFVEFIVDSTEGELNIREVI
ncbi:DUF2634 domain-containing protein [Dethiothermospora halolimnae]|uniref:DUF2634 domain-containing protein n=1 Tax=Dethiothermospora halolimnae TaxID=3114390 RepID=UPI003CCC072E